MARLSLALLGPPEVRRDGRPLRLRTRKEMGLLAYLAIEPGRHSREKLAALLWPESPRARARTSLRGALAGLHLVFPDPPGASGGPRLLAGNGYVGLELTPESDLDLRAVQAAFVVARRSWAAARPPDGEPEMDARRDALNQLRAALDLYRGDFLEGLYIDDAPDFEYWASLEREAWRNRMEAILDGLSRLQLEGGKLDDAVATATRWATDNPLSEEAHGRLMQAQLAAGDPIGALHAYEDLRAALAEHVDAKPRPETEALAAAARSATPSRYAMRRAPAGAGSMPSLPRKPLVGRAQDFDALIVNYYAASRGETRVVTVFGDSGIGKTRLVEEFLDWASAQGTENVRSRPSESGERIPYGALIDTLRDRVERERAPEDLLSDTWLAELGRLLPELRDRYPDLPHRTADDAAARTRLFEAVARLVQALADRAAPVVLFVDDLHWADRSSLDLLHYAARRWTESETPVLLLLCVGADFLTATPALEAWLSDLERVSAVTRLDLKHLSREDLVQVAREMAAVNQEMDGQRRADEAAPSPVDLDRFGGWLFEETGGHPLCMTETLEALLERGLLAVRPNGDAGWRLDVRVTDHNVASLPSFVTGGVRDIILARLRHLSPKARALLAAGAVLDRGITFERLRRVADLSQGKGLSALDESLGSHLVRETQGAMEEREEYAFVHDKVRAVVYEQENPARRRLLHRRALNVLRDTAPAAQLARHALEAKLPEEIYRYGVAAGDDAIRLFAAHEAAAHYAHARRVVEEGPAASRLRAKLSSAELRHLYLQLGRARMLAFEWDGADTVYRGLLSLARERRDPTTERAALNALANLTVHRSYDLAAARELLERALRISNTDDDRIGLAETEWNLAQVAYYAWDPATSLAHGENALELARESDDKNLTARSLYALANARWRLGRVEQAAAAAEEARSLYAEEGDRAMEADSLRLLAHTRIHSGRPREGIYAAREALDVCQKIYHPWGQVQSARVLSLGLTEAGEYQEAYLLAGQNVVDARSLDHALLLFISLHAFGKACQALFRLEEARDAYLEALKISTGTLAVRPYAAAMATQLCAVCSLSGDSTGSRDYALQALEFRDPTLLMITDFVRWYETQALLRAGEGARAREDIRRFGEHAASNRRYRIPYLRALAVLALWDGDADGALNHLSEAAGLADALGLPGELWQTTSSMGELHRSRGENNEARRAFIRAAKIIRSLAERLDDGALREDFLGAPEVRRVLKGPHTPL